MTEIQQARSHYRHWRMAFGGVLLLGMTVATYTTPVLGVLAPFMVDEFQMSRSQLGLLTTVLYLVGGFGSPLAGRLVDLLGGRLALEAIFVAGVLGTAGMALAGSYGWLLAAMVVMGISLAGGNPATNKLLTLHMPAGTRGAIMGVKQAGVPMATFLSGAIMPGAALKFGWRGAAALALVLPAIGVISNWKLLPKDDPELASTRAESSAPLHSSVGWLTTYAVFMGAGVSVVNVYLPLYAFDAVGAPVTTAGIISSFIGLTGIVSRVVWGRLYDRMRTVALPLFVIGVCSTTSILLTAAAQVAWGGVWLLWIAAFLFGLSALGWIVVGMIGMVERTGLQQAGRASGRVLLGFYGGFVLSPIGFGALVDATGTYGFAWVLTAASFATASVIALFWHRASCRLVNEDVSLPVGR